LPQFLSRNNPISRNLTRNTKPLSPLKFLFPIPAGRKNFEWFFATYAAIRLNT
jgi:hypothetical protein